jgi:hypothetical protein
LVFAAGRAGAEREDRGGSFDELPKKVARIDGPAWDLVRRNVTPISEAIS